jgi:rhamnose utilization protein RhaD (predicted bifunctional aldolase and dehydrogenase)
VLAEFQAMAAPSLAAGVAQELCLASAGIAELSGERASFEQAVADCGQAEELLRREGADTEAAEAGSRREAAEAALGALEP